MPIHVSEYTWHQTAEKVTLSLDLHHTSPKNVDIVATSSYLKVSFLPYIFEGFLSRRVDAEHSRARAIGGRLELDLLKEIAAETWGDACVQLTPEEKLTRRQDAGREMEEQEKRRAKKLKEDRNHRERFAVSQQISTDDLARGERKKIIEKVKEEFLRQPDHSESQEEEKEKCEVDEVVEEEKNVTEDEKLRRKIEVMKADQLNSEENNLGKKEESEESEVQERKQWSSAGSEDGGPVVEQDYDGDGEDSIHYSSTENLHHLPGNSKMDNMSRKQKKSTSNRKAAGKENDGKGMKAEKDEIEMKEETGQKESEEKKREVRKKKLPPVRQFSNITVSHTPRVFPTPSRESTQQEEQQWLASQSVVPAADKDNDNNTSTALEHFKKKAVFLFKSGDYRGCVNACTEALALAPSAPTFFSNRAAANLALGNLHHAVNDCSKALELLMPGTPDNLKSRLLCHVRRGTALVRLGLVSAGGLADYEAALELTPDDSSLKQDVMRLRNLARGSDSEEDESDSGCEDAQGGLVGS